MYVLIFFFVFFAAKFPGLEMWDIHRGSSFKKLKVSGFKKPLRFHGEVQEWLNWHAWKACVPLKGTEGSNPSLSANAI
jgi:hypothetical protein